MIIHYLKLDNINYIVLVNNNFGQVSQSNHDTIILLFKMIQNESLKLLLATENLQQLTLNLNYNTLYRCHYLKFECM